MGDTWTISELAERAAAALAADGSAQVSGRVRDLPNERLIRWYTTIGLVDPPLGRRGRTALYGHRHLLQLVAVKRRQAAGRSIAEIQLELAAATDATLERIAALPHSPAADGARPRQEPAADHPTAKPTPTSPGHPAREASPANPPTSPLSTPTTPTTTAPTPGVRPAATSVPHQSGETTPGNDHPLPASTTTHQPDEAAPQQSPADAPSNAPATEPTGGTPSAARDDFWSRRPDVSFTETAVVGDYGGPDGPAEPGPSVVQGIRLASGLTLLLDVPALSGDDLAAIETAARPLLDELHRRGLLTPATSPEIPPAAPSRRFQ